MAFKILKEDEISLLTDRQKKHYERELDIYRKRAAFVEQLEKYENTVLKPYEPKLKPIAVINKNDVREFRTQEYKAQIPVYVKKPEIVLNPIEIHTSAAINVPDVSVHTLEVKPVIIEKKQPSVPSVEKPVAVATKFALPKPAQPNLPSVEKPVSVAAKFALPKTAQPNVPSVAKPEFTAATFKQPEKSQIVLPLVKKPEVDALLSARRIDYKDKQTPGNVPSVTVANISVLPSVNIKKEAPVLPQAAFEPPVVKAFIKPAGKQAELPVISRSVIPSKQMNIKKASLQQLPQVKGPDISVKPYAKPESPVAILTAIAKPDIPAASFQPLKISSVKLPSAAIKSPAIKELQPFKREAISLTAPKTQVIPVKSFRKVKKEFAEVPRQNRAAIPDAREALEKFFPSSMEKPDITAGQVV